MDNQISNQNLQQQPESENTISIKDIIFIVINNWYWFAISVVVCLVIAAFAYKAQPKSYSASGTIMVRDNGKKVYSGGNMDAIFSNLGMDNSSLSLENEIYMLRSSSLMDQVVIRLGLDHPCSRHDLFRKISYYKDAPLYLSATGIGFSPDTTDLEIHIDITPKDNNKYEYKVKNINNPQVGKAKGEAYYNEQVELNGGVTFLVEKTAHYNDNFEDVTLSMAVVPVHRMARNMLKDLQVARADKLASILSITYKDNNPRRANEIVDTLIAVYNYDVVNDKNKVAEKTEQFISERIALISDELSSVDAQVADIKKSAQVPDIDAASGTLVQSATRYGDAVAAAEAELNLIRYLRNYMNDPQNQDNLLPALSGLGDSGIQSMIASYNRSVNEYNRMISAGSNNPQRKTAKQQMDTQFEAILTSINNLITATEIRLQTARDQESQAKNRISSVPTQAKAVTEIGRQQKRTLPLPAQQT